MVGQIGAYDYSMTGIPAIEQALLGFGQGQQMQLNRAQDQRAAQGQAFDQGLASQEMEMRQQALAMEQQAQAQAAAERQAAVAAAQAGQAAMVDLMQDPNPTWDKVAATMEANPQMAMELRDWYQGQVPDARAQTISDAAKMAYALSSGNDDLARQMMEERAIAAEVGGDKQAADTARSMLAMMATPEGVQAVKASLLGTIHTIATPEELAAIGDQLFPKAPEMEWRPATEEEAAANGAVAGQINVKTGKFDAQNPPSGMSLTTNPDGTMTLQQGPGAGASGGLTTANNTDAQKAVMAYDSLTKSLDDYEALFAKTGGEVIPGEGKDALLGARRAMQLQMKELFNLGVLNGPDLALMDALMVDPTSLANNAMDIVGIADLKGRIKANTAQLRQTFETMVKPKIEAMKNGTGKATGAQVLNYNPVTGEFE